MIKKRKVAIVGCCFVGTSLAYALVNQGQVNEIAMIDIKKDKAEGEQMDLSHGLAYYPQSNVKIVSGGYELCKDADIVAITAGTPQNEMAKSRLDFTDKTTRIVKSITESVVQSGFNGIFVVASNPVDLMAYVIQKVSGFDKKKIIGTGVMLDTSRLRYMLSEYFKVSCKNVHAYILGEHGDSSFVCWSNAYIGCKRLFDIIEQKNIDMKELDDIYENVRKAGYEVLKRKNATYYGIGMITARIISSIFNDENVILPVSSYLDGQYGQKGLYIGAPAIINAEGNEKVIELRLTSIEEENFNNSVNILKGVIDNSVDKILIE